MRITFDPQTNRITAQTGFAQNFRVLNEDVTAQLKRDSGLVSGKLQATAYKALRGDSLIVVTGEDYRKLYVLHTDGRLSSQFSPQDLKNLKQEMDFADAKRAEPNLKSYEAELQAWKDNKAMKLEELKRGGSYKDGNGFPLTIKEKYAMEIADRKAAIGHLNKNLKLRVTKADTREITLP